VVSNQVPSSEPISVRTGNAVLAGEVWHPQTDLQAGVVMVGGSGPTDRSNGGYFVPYRDQFTDHGIAMLWYDKRGVGESAGDWRAGTLDDLATDAIAAMSALQQMLDDAIPVGLFGHSEGGWVALRAAARSGCAGFVVTNSCPGTTPGQQDRHAVVTAINADARAEPDRAAALRLYDVLAEAAAQDRDYAFVQQLLASAPGSGTLRAYVEPMGELTWAFFKRERDHDPMPDCLALRCPHLVIFGSADRLVPIEESVAAFTASARDTRRHPRATTTIHIVPHADHRLLTPGNSAPSEHHLADLCAWVKNASAKDVTDLPGV
jgi:uncharacterized protein